MMKKKINNEQDSVWNVCEYIFGDSNGNDFINVKNKGGTEVTKMIGYALEDRKMKPSALEKYLTIIDICNGAMIVRNSSPIAKILDKK